MIKIHNISVYHRFYDLFSNSFIDNYCEARQRGKSKKESFYIAKLTLRDLVINELSHRRNKSIVLAVFHDLKNDQELYEKALSTFGRMN